MPEQPTDHPQQETTPKETVARREDRNTIPRDEHVKRLMEYHEQRQQQPGKFDR